MRGAVAVGQTAGVVRSAIDHSTGRRVPPARSLLIRFGVIGAVVALGVVALLTVGLVRVLTRAQDTIYSDLEAAVAAQLEQASAQQADVVSQELEAVTNATSYLADAAVDVLANPVDPSPVELANHGPGPNGSWVTLADIGGAAMYYSGAVAIGPEQKEKAGHVAALDPALRAIVESSALVAQAYLNTWDSLNRIYPYFDGADQYPPRMDIPSYNFYYEADEVHNPDRGVEWTDVYVDPAGMGWMVSAIAPSYVGDRLEGVVGLDVTVEALVGGLLSSDQAFDSYSLLIDQNGVIMAMPAAAEELLGLEELTDVDYATFVSQDTFKPEDFDIDARSDTAALAELVFSESDGSGEVDVAGRQSFVAYHVLPQTGWRIVTIAEHAAIEELNAPAERLDDTLTAIIVLLGLAATALVALLTWRARVLSISFTRPLVAIDDATMRIARGEFHPTVPNAPIAELERTRLHLLEMGARLEAAQVRMVADAERLRENEERYRTIFANVGEAVVAVDSRGIITDANDAADALVGADPVGLDIADLLPGEAWRVIGRHNVEAPLDDGTVRRYVLSVSSWGEGEGVRYIVTARDVTAEEERERLLDEARRDAERTARLKDEFLASMSHEIRTPMNGVIGMLSLMSETDLPDDARQHLEVARRSAADLLVLVNDVLDVSKLEADQVTVEPTDVAVAELVDGVIDLLSPLAEEQGDSLTATIEPSVPAYLRVDPTRLRQIVVNLVGNALKFTENGSVRISASFTPATSGEAHGTLRMEVVDDGQGVPEELQPRLFTRFSQGNPMAARRFRGTGLGLAIVKRLVELMGGEVGFTSTVGVGSTFWFTVQAEPGEAPVAVPVVPAADRGDRPLRVLVAEDNEVNQLLFVKMLERLGHEAVTVGDGRQAVEAVQRERFDIVLMDVQMPELSGVDATQAIRSLPGDVAEIPILAITANVLPEQQAAYLEAGMTGCLPKPLTLSELAAGLDACTR